MLIIGIDVGLQGAIAFYDSAARMLLGVEDMPVDYAVVAGENRGFVSEARLLAVLKGAEGAHAFVEEPEGRPLRGRDRQTGATVLRHPGAKRMLSLGASYGIARCACVASGMAITAVSPGAWKRAMGVSGDDARRRATELYPSMAKLFARKKDGGRADACLLSAWGASRLAK